MNFSILKIFLARAPERVSVEYSDSSVKLKFEIHFSSTEREVFTQLAHICLFFSARINVRIKNLRLQLKLRWSKLFSFTKRKVIPNPRFFELKLMSY